MENRIVTNSKMILENERKDKLEELLENHSLCCKQDIFDFMQEYKNVFSLSFLAKMFHTTIQSYKNSINTPFPYEKNIFSSIFIRYVNNYNSNLSRRYLIDNLQSDRISVHIFPEYSSYPNIYKLDRIDSAVFKSKLLNLHVDNWPHIMDSSNSDSNYIWDLIYIDLNNQRETKRGYNVSPICYQRLIQLIESVMKEN